MTANPVVQNQGYYTTGLPVAAETAGTLGSVTLPFTGNETLAYETNLGNGVNPATAQAGINALSSYDAPAIAVPYAATVTLDLAAPTNFFVIGTLTGNINLANPINLTSGAQWTVELVQDATGSRTFSHGSLYKISGAISTTANYIDTLTCRYDGTTILGVFANHYA